MRFTVKDLRAVNNLLRSAAPRGGHPENEHVYASGDGAIATFRAHGDVEDGSHASFATGRRRITLEIRVPYKGASLAPRALSPRKLGTILAAGKAATPITLSDGARVELGTRRLTLEAPPLVEPEAVPAPLHHVGAYYEANAFSEALTYVVPAMTPDPRRLSYRGAVIEPSRGEVVGTNGWVLHLVRVQPSFEGAGEPFHSLPTGFTLPMEAATLLQKALAAFPGGEVVVHTSGGVGEPVEVRLEAPGATVTIRTYVHSDGLPYWQILDRSDWTAAVDAAQLREAVELAAKLADRGEKQGFLTPSPDGSTLTMEAYGLTETVAVNEAKGFNVDVTRRLRLNLLYLRDALPKDGSVTIGQKHRFDKTGKPDSEDQIKTALRLDQGAKTALVMPVKY